MPAPFAQVSVAQFAELLERFPFTRRINAVHMHHTWKPDRSMYRGHETIVGMWRHHTQTNNWSDIGQHISIAPDGSIWLGRNWNAPPASAAGHNGSAAAGPFMFEMIGDFDVGRDPFDGPQRETVLQIIALVQARFDLPPESLMFHNMMSSKSCPGSAIDYGAFLEEVRARRTQAAPATGSRAVKGGKVRPRAFGRDMEAEPAGIARALELLLRETPLARGETADADHEGIEAFLPEAAARGGGGDGELTPPMLDALRPHVINLRAGRFSSDGLMTTTPADVDALFDDHLERALREVKARDAAARLRLVFFAHGGLVSESAGLRIAHKHLAWWRRNGVYPINFVWETGLWEALADLVLRTRGQAERSILSDAITDPIIEAALRVLPAESIWSGMKFSAEKASAARGGARYAAERLKGFCDRHPDDVELHAVGHSAGSVFHSHFLPACAELGVPTFARAQFLAPAVRVDTFLETLGPRIGAGKSVERVDLFTMRKDLELDDTCTPFYRKSLLYLVSASAETGVGTPLLGLEESLRASADCVALFGLRGAASTLGEVVWSTSAAADGRSATRSTTHGGFDDDPPTMGSVVRRILGKADADPIEPYVPSPAARGVAGGDIDWPRALRTVRPARVSIQPSATAPAVGGAAAARAGGGRRRALCIGVDEYAIRPLAGCVADARLWAETLQALGFETPTTLLNGAATRTAILGAMESLIAAATPGDTLVIQFAGHGTQVQDIDGDEAGGDTPGLDEALCPIDFPAGAFVIDDDIAALCDRIPDGVSVTFFTDCCHSGSVTRLGIGPQGAAAHAADERPRFITATAEMHAAHVRYRAQLGRARAAAPRTIQREVLFSACRSDQVAWESNGHGDFTLKATALLRQGVEDLSNEAFQARVLQTFGPGARQAPELHCAPTSRAAALFGAARAVAGTAPAGAGDPTVRLVAALKGFLDGWAGPSQG